MSELTAFLTPIASRASDLAKLPGVRDDFGSRLRRWGEVFCALFQAEDEWKKRRERAAELIAIDKRLQDIAAGRPGDGWNFDTFARHEPFAVVVSKRQFEPADTIHGWKHDLLGGWFPPDATWSSKPAVEPPIAVIRGVPGEERERVLTVDEEFVLLAAIHDRVFMAHPDKLNPWFQNTDEIDGRLFKNTPESHFWFQMRQVEGLGSNVEPHLLKIVAHVEELCRTRAPDKTAPSHAPDFTSVNWFGTHYLFTKGNQAEAVRILWREWESGGHGVSAETIGREIDSAANRFELSKVFRRKRPGGGYERHPAWGTMIQATLKGSYRLVPPESAKNPH